VHDMTFGIELEFFLLDAGGYPAMNSTSEVIRLWRARNFPNAPVPELGSYQIELNPGPWPLTPSGIDRAIRELQRDAGCLRHCAAELGYAVSAAPIVPRIEKSQLLDPALLTKDPRSRATSRYFSHRQANAVFTNGDQLVFPGETVLACLNEIHIHIQPENDEAAIALFNEFNRSGGELIREYQTPIELNGQFLIPSCTTMKLFEEADGERGASGKLRRVGFLPHPIRSFEEYQRAISSFQKIPCPELEPPFLDLESSVWFWTRLRNRPGALRVEFRPMDMGADWDERVRFLTASACQLLEACRDRVPEYVH
jgi:hypothetical protein